MLVYNIAGVYYAMLHPTRPHAPTKQREHAYVAKGRTREEAITNVLTRAGLLNN